MVDPSWGEGAVQVWLLDVTAKFVGVRVNLSFISLLEQS
jgi:hypothetical protein